MSQPDCDPNGVAVEFISTHPDWEMIVDDDGDVLMLVSPFYVFNRQRDDN